MSVPLRALTFCAVAVLGALASPVGPAAALGPGAGAGPAAGPAVGLGAAHAQPPAVIDVAAESLFPESLDWDARRQRFVVSSVSQGTLSIVGLDGTVQPLVRDSRLISTPGLRVDGARDRVLATNLAVDGSVSGVGSWDLRTGRAQWYVDLVEVAADGGPHFTNDVAVAPDGTAYVIDAVSPTIYRVDREGHASVWLRDDALAPNGSLPGFQPHFGTNAITWVPGNVLLVAKIDGTLLRIPVDRPASIEPIRLTGELGVYVDGIHTLADGRVAVVTNGWFGAPGSLQLIRGTAAWHRAEITRTTVLPDPLPMGVTEGPGGWIYTMTGRLDLVFQGRPSDGFTLRRADR